MAVLWNKELNTERKGKKDWYADYNQEFEVMGVKVISTRMRDISITRRDGATMGFIKSTRCWPASNIQMRCPYLEDIFREVKDMLDSCVDPFCLGYGDEMRNR